MCSGKVNSELSPERREQPCKLLKEALKARESKCNDLETKNRLATFKELVGKTCNEAESVKGMGRMIRGRVREGPQHAGEVEANVTPINTSVQTLHYIRLKGTFRLASVRHFCLGL